MIRWSLVLISLAAAAALAWLLFNSEPAAGILVAIMLLAFLVPIWQRLLFSRPLDAGEKQRRRSVVAFRQARAMVRREDGEITGAPPGAP